MPRTAPQPEPKITPFGVAEDGVMVLLRSDPAGMLDAPEFESVLLAVHVGAAARITCRRAGQVHTGSAVHGDIDLIPARTASRRRARASSRSCSALAARVLVTVARIPPAAYGAPAIRATNSSERSPANTRCV